MNLTEEVRDGWDLFEVDAGRRNQSAQRKRSRIKASRGQTSSNTSRRDVSEWDFRRTLEQNSLGYDGTESSSLHLNVSSSFLAFLDNLCTYVLSFSIAICPDYQQLSMSSFLDQIGWDVSAILGSSRERNGTREGERVSKVVITRVYAFIYDPRKCIMNSILHFS